MEGGWKTTLVNIDTNQKSDPILSTTKFLDGVITDLQVVDGDIIGLVRKRLPGKTGADLGDIGLYKIDGQTMEASSLFEFGGATIELPQKLIPLDSNTFAIIGFVENSKVPILKRRYELIVTEVIPESPASLAGIRENDVVASIDGEKILDGSRFIEIVQANPGQAIEIVVLRSKSPMSLKVVPREMIIGEEKQVFIGVRFDEKLVEATASEPESTSQALRGQWFKPESTFSSFAAVFQKNGDFVSDVMTISPTGAMLVDAIQVSSDQFVAVGHGGKLDRVIAQYTLH